MNATHKHEQEMKNILLQNIKTKQQHKHNTKIENDRLKEPNTQT